MKKILVISFLFMIGAASLFAQQKMDVNGDGKPETVFSHAGKKYFYRIEFDFNDDSKNDIALLLNENTGKYLSLEVVRSTWPMVKGVGSEQWMAEKKAAARRFWADRASSAATCDICSAAVSKDDGYVLSSRDVLCNNNYVNLTEQDSFMKTMMGDSYDPVQSRLSFWELMFKSGMNTPWLLCDDCIRDWAALN